MIRAERDQPAPSVKVKNGTARPLAWRLVVLCAAVTMPILAFAALVLTQYAAGARDRLEREGLEAVRDIADDLDRDTSNLTAILQTLSYSTRISDRDFAGFHKLAVQVARNTGLPLVLSDLSGQQVVNTRLPFGAELPRVAIAYDDVIATGKPKVYDLFRGAVAQTFIYSLAAPVLSADESRVEYVLNFSMDPGRIQGRLLTANLGPDAYAGVIDRNGHMMARTIDHDKYLGSTPHPFLDAVAGRQEGQARIVNRDGNEILASFTRMKSTGWTVAYGVPVHVIDQPVRALIWEVLGLALLSAGIAGTGGFVYSRSIVRALSSLGHAASDVGRGEIVEQVCTSVTEINEVGSRLALASHDLRQITGAKDALLYEVNHRVKNSLAVVTSLLAMHVRQTRDEALSRGLVDLRARIDVIASVHQRLYESGRHDHLDLGEFLHEIAADMIQALGASRHHLVSDCERGIIIGVDRTTPLALIVGELLTNAIKHGGEHITLSLTRAADGPVQVIVADDGPGLPSGFVAGAGSGMGMRIVSGLVRQLRGRLETDAGAGGTRFTLTLNEAAE